MGLEEHRRGTMIGVRLISHQLKNVITNVRDSGRDHFLTMHAIAELNILLGKQEDGDAKTAVIDARDLVKENLGLSERIYDMITETANKLGSNE